MLLKRNWKWLYPIIFGVSLSVLFPLYYHFGYLPEGSRDVIDEFLIYLFCLRGDGSSGFESIGAVYYGMPIYFGILGFVIGLALWRKWVGIICLFIFLAISIRAYIGSVEFTNEKEAKQKIHKVIRETQGKY